MGSYEARRLGGDAKGSDGDWTAKPQGDVALGLRCSWRED